LKLLPDPDSGKKLIFKAKIAIFQAQTFVFTHRECAQSIPHLILPLEEYFLEKNFRSKIMKKYQTYGLLDKNCVLKICLKIEIFG
jgi:hypothetical protein